MNRCLFVDMNAFFASVEQQERPELRGRPVIVAPLLADTTCAIAASYEAKALGIKTGTQVKAARRLCPEIEVVEARPGLYLQYHAGILEVLEELFVGVKTLSVDEMACRVNRLHVGREAETRLGQDLKRRLYRRLGDRMRCSVGVAPNVFLAKVASEAQKPDGLTVWDGDSLPEALFELDLLDLPGIGMRMATRLERHGIRTTRQLYEASELELRRAWGGVVGDKWYAMLRGSQTADYAANLPEVRKSVGHSHVLPPEYRTEAGARAILLQLFTKCMKRLRAYGQAAGAVEVWAQYENKKTYAWHGWQQRSRKHLHSNDDRTWLKTVRPLVEALPMAGPDCCVKKVGIVFTDLLLCQDVNLSLFEDGEETAQLGRTVDALNSQGTKVGLASVWEVREQAPLRIAFGRPA